MTIDEALRRMRCAALDEVVIDPEMVFGYGPMDALEMLHDAISCIEADQGYVVTSSEYTFLCRIGVRIIIVRAPVPRR